MMNTTDAQCYDSSSGDEEQDLKRLSDVLHAQLSFQSETDLQSSSDEEFQTTPPTVKKMSEVGVVVDADEDDGWISDNEECAPVVLTNQAANTGTRKLYMDYEDEVWVDEARGTFSTYNTCDPSKITDLLEEMFDAHDDVYSLVIAFLKQTGRTRMQKKSLPRILLTEFQLWLKNKACNGGTVPKNAVLTHGHRHQALRILTKCHSVIMDDMTAVFDLMSAPKEAQLELIDTLLAQDRLKETVTYVWKFRLQQHYEMDQMLLPLVALDKINLIENYIDDSSHLQEKFVRLLDDLCEPGTTKSKIKQFLSKCTLGPKSLDRDALSKSNCKLNFRQVYRLAHRMVTKYNLDLSMFPNLYDRKTSGSLHHLLIMRYVEGSITEQNMEDLVEAVVRDNVSLQLQLIKELVNFNDLPTALRWSVKCNLPVDHLPASIQSYLREPATPYAGTSHNHTHTTRGHTHHRDYYKLPLPLSSVVFVEARIQLDVCWQAISKPNIVIGIDAEWRLPSCNGGKERLAVLQLAVTEAVYLLDMVCLPGVVGESTLKHFMLTLFHSEHSLKLGYGIQCDLHMLSKSWPFVADTISSSERVVDLRSMEMMIEKLKRRGNTTTFNPILPLHPLLMNKQIRTSDRSKVTPLSCDSKLPEHPLLLHHRKLRGKSHPHNVAPHSGIAVQVSSPPSQLALSCDDQTSPSLMSSDPRPHTFVEGVGRHDDPYGVSVRRGGLSALVAKCFGKTLDKSQQLSDWEKRPLYPEQVAYAALDAHCLLGVYKYLRSEALTFDPTFNVEPTIKPSSKKTIVTRLP